MRRIKKYPARMFPYQNNSLCKNLPLAMKKDQAELNNKKESSHWSRRFDQ